VQHSNALNTPSNCKNLISTESNVNIEEGSRTASTSQNQTMIIITETIMLWLTEFTKIHQTQNGINAGTQNGSTDLDTLGVVTATLQSPVLLARLPPTEHSSDTAGGLEHELLAPDLGAGVTVRAGVVEM
jgi:hypothetical protein